MVVRRACPWVLCVALIAISLHFTLFTHQLDSAREGTEDVDDDVEMEEEEGELIEWLEQAWLKETTLLPAFDDHFIEHCRASYQQQQQQHLQQLGDNGREVAPLASPFAVSLCQHQSQNKLFLFLNPFLMLL